MLELTAAEDPSFLADDCHRGRLYALVENGVPGTTWLVSTET
jgi:hypothetical protein